MSSMSSVDILVWHRISDVTTTQLRPDSEHSDGNQQVLEVNPTTGKGDCRVNFADYL